jgi:hypothetical protein
LNPLFIVIPAVILLGVVGYLGFLAIRSRRNSYYPTSSSTPVIPKVDNSISSSHSTFLRTPPKTPPPGSVIAPKDGVSTIVNDTNSKEVINPTVVGPGDNQGPRV